MSRFIFWSFTVALAGFLFGFDIVVTSGVDKILQQLWATSDSFHGFVVIGGALWGTVLGAMIGGWPTNAWGRKKTLIVIGVLYFVSAAGAGLAADPWSFALFRFIGGLGIGASTIAAPAYISEIAPARSRGRLVATYQLSIVLGIMASFLSNYLLSESGENAWRWMVGVGAFPALAYLGMIFLVPESPRWLLLKGRREEAAHVLKSIDPQMNMEEFARANPPASAKAGETIFGRKYSKPLLLAFFVAFFNQLSGINAFLYYSPRIFEVAGLGSSTAFLSSVGVGIVNVVFTVVGMALIDRLGRKQLMYIGSIGYIVSLTMVAFAFILGWQGMVVPLCFFLFIASHAIGQGTVIWVFIAEVFPNHLRASGQAFGSSVHWVLAALIPSVVPATFTAFGPGVVFAFFAAMMVCQLAWVAIAMPETKGVSLEEMGGQLDGK
ncbi:MAG: sugar porter family MFS transporter [Bacteroidia bacterium]